MVTIQGAPAVATYSPLRGEAYIFRNGHMITFHSDSFEGIDIDLDNCTEEQLAVAIEEILGADMLEDIIPEEDI